MRGTSEDEAGAPGGGRGSRETHLSCIIKPSLESTMDEMEYSANGILCRGPSCAPSFKANEEKKIYTEQNQRVRVPGPVVESM